jgi:hypothetical protein
VKNLWTASPETDIDKDPRKDRRRDLKQVEGANLVEVSKLMEHVERKQDSQIQILRTYVHNKNSTPISNV